MDNKLNYVLRTVAITLGTIGILPYFYPLLYINNVPVLASGLYSSNVYIADAEIIRLLFIPILLSSIILVLLGIFGWGETHDPLLVVIVTYTLSNIPIMFLPKLPPVKEAVTQLVSVSYILDMHIEYTWLYTLFHEGIIFLVGLFLSTLIGLMVALETGILDRYL